MELGLSSPYLLSYKKIEVIRTGAAISPASGLVLFIKEKYAFAIWAKN